MGLFQSARTAPPKFGCFGKLPGHGDFLSLNLDGPEAQALATWLSDGIGAAPSVAGVQPDQVVHFVWTPDRGRRTLVGAVRQSVDAVGRQFPFAVFTSFPQQQLAPHGNRTVLAVEAVRRRIHEIFTRVAPLQRIRDVYTTVEQAPMPPVAEPGEVLRLWGERVDAPTLRREDVAAYASHMLDLARLAARLRDAPELPDFALHLQLLGDDPDAELGVWAQLLCDRVNVPELDVAWFLRFVRGRPSAYLFHRGMEPSDVAFMLGGYDEYPRAESIGFRANGNGAARDRVAENLQRMWVSRHPSFRSLLDTAGLVDDVTAATSVPTPVPAPRDRRVAPAASGPPAKAPTTGPVTGAHASATQPIPAGASAAPGARAAAGAPAAPAGQVAAAAAATRVVVVPASLPPLAQAPQGPPAAPSSGSTARAPAPAAAAPAAAPAGAAVTPDQAETLDDGSSAAAATVAAVASAVAAAAAPAVAAAAAAVTGPVSAAAPEPATGPAVTTAPAPATSPGAEAVTGDAEVPVADLPDADLAAKIEKLAAGALLPGRLVKAAAIAQASAAETAETEHFEGHSVLLYLEDTGHAALLTGLSRESVQRVEQEIAAHREAMALLAEMARRHRAIEEWLSGQVQSACDRSRRPGAPTPAEGATPGPPQGGTSGTTPAA